jgi:hypothetical protein
VALLRGSEELAHAYAAHIPLSATHLIIAQPLLPFLWREGALGGRTYEVLMSRLPMAEIHARLDAARAANPERALLGDFRAEQRLVEDETRALRAASKIVTPHAAIAGLFPDALLIPWEQPAPRAWRRGKSIAFPGPVASRKGAFEVREAAKVLDLEVVSLGSELEGDDFWGSMSVRKPDDNWLDGVAVVVQPAILEDRPRRLLEALASGCPVVATDACGLAPHPLLTIVPAGDSAALVETLRNLLPNES